MLSRIEKIFSTNRPVAWFLRKSKEWYLPGFEGNSLFDVIRTFYRQVKIQGMTERASAISYNFIMSIPPSLLFLFTLIPHLPFISMNSIRVQLHTLIYEMIPSREYNEDIIAFVDSFMEGSKIGLLSFVFVLSLFFASSAMMGLMRSFNKNYIGFSRRKTLVKRWTAIKLTMMMFGLLLGYLTLLIMQGNLLELIVEDSGWRTAISYIRWIFIFLLVFFAIAIIYKYAPAVEKRWKILSPGTIIATCLSILASAGFAAFVNNFGRYNALYGSIGTIMMFMALIYINSFVLLIGFELNVSIKTLKSHKEALEKNGEAGKV